MGRRKEGRKKGELSPSQHTQITCWIIGIQTKAIATIKILKGGPGELDHQLRELATPAEALSSIPSTPTPFGPQNFNSRVRGFLLTSEGTRSQGHIPCPPPLKIK